MTGPEQQGVVMADGTRNEVTLFRNALEAEAPVVVCMPAMGAPASFYRPLAERLCQAGFHAVTADLRGHGKSSVRAGRGVRFGYKEMLEQDYPAVLAAARAAFPGSRLLLLGHSLGGQLGALYLGMHPEQASGLVLMAACSVHYKGWDFPYSLGVLAFTQLARAMAAVWGYFPGRLFRFGGNESRQSIRDWAHQARTGRWEPEGLSLDMDALLGRLELPVLAISIEADRLAPARAVDDLCRRLGRARLTRWHCSARDFGRERLDHFSWVRTPGPLVTRVRGWLEELERTGALDAATPPPLHEVRT